MAFDIDKELDSLTNEFDVDAELDALQPAPFDIDKEIQALPTGEFNIDNELNALQKPAVEQADEGRITATMGQRAKAFGGNLIDLTATTVEESRALTAGPTTEEAPSMGLSISESIGNWNEANPDASIGQMWKAYKDIIKRPMAETAAKRRTETEQILGRKIRGLRTDSMETAQQSVEEAMASGDQKFIAQGLNMIATNPQLALSFIPGMAEGSMYAMEARSMRDELMQAGFKDGDPILEDASRLYGLTSGAIERLEMGGRGQAFGKKIIGEKATVAVTKTLKRPIAKMLKGAGINIGEEITQDILSDLIYNDAIKKFNEANGTSIPMKKMTWSRIKETSFNSAAMSTVLEAIGIPTRHVRGKINMARTSNRLQSKLGMDKATADTAASKLTKAETQEEYDSIRAEILEQETEKGRVRDQILGENAERISELAHAENLTDEERAEFMELIAQSNSEGVVDAESQRISNDVRDITRGNVQAYFDETTTYSDPDLVQIAVEINDMYGIKNTDENISTRAKQILDMYIEPKQRISVEQKVEKQKRELSDYRESLKKWRKGKIRTAEVIEMLGEIDPALVEEFNERIDGENAEKPSAVLNDMVAKIEKQQEVQDDTERKPEVGTEQEGKPGQEPVAAPEADGTATEQDTGAPEAGVVNIDNDGTITDGVVEQGVPLSINVTHLGPEGIEGFKPNHAGVIYFAGNDAIDLLENVSGGSKGKTRYNKTVTLNNPFIAKVPADSPFLSKKRVDELKEQGFDGVVWKVDNKVEEVVAFDNNQINDPQKPTPAEPGAKETGVEGKPVEVKETTPQQEEAKSEILDEGIAKQGAPTVVNAFHGSTESISEFDTTDKSGIPSPDYRRDRIGSFFSSLSSSAKSFGDNVYNRYISFTNPVVVDGQDGLNRLINHLREYSEEDQLQWTKPKEVNGKWVTKNFHELDDGYKEYLEDRRFDTEEQAVAFHDERMRIFEKGTPQYRLRAMGFDGVIVKNPDYQTGKDETWYIVFDKKSITNEDPSISDTAKPAPAPKAETLTPISQVEDTPVVDPMKDVYPPNPQLPEAQWRKEMLDFAVKNVQAGVSRSQFVSEMESELHKNVSVEELGDIWRQAQRDAKRIAKAVKQAEKTSAKAKVTQGQFKDTETETVKSSTLIKELFRVQQRASKQGRKAGIAEIKELLKQKKLNADELRKNFKEQMKGLKRAREVERLRLDKAMSKIQLAETPEAQLKAFDKAMTLLEETFDAVEGRKKEYRYEPYETPTTLSGLDRHSKYQDIRGAFLERGGDAKVRSATSMLSYLNGSPSKAAGAEVRTDVESLKKSKAINTKLAKAARRISNIISRGSNLSDMIEKITLGDENAKLQKDMRELNRSRNAEERIIGEQKAFIAEKKVAEHLGELNGTADLNIGGKKYKITIGQLLSLYLNTKNKDNIKALGGGQIVMKGTQVGNLFTHTGERVIDFNIDDLINGINEAVDSLDNKDSFDAIIDAWVDYTSNMRPNLIKEKFNAIAERLGIDKRWDDIKGVYFPIQHQDKSDTNIDTRKIGDEVYSYDKNNDVMSTLFAPERTSGAKGAIKIPDLMMLWNGLINSTATFAGSAEARMELGRTLNNEDLRTNIRTTFGNKFLKSINSKLDEILETQQHMEKGMPDKIAGKAITSFTPLRLWNVFTGMKMFSSAAYGRKFLTNKNASMKFATNNLNDKFFAEKMMGDASIANRWDDEKFIAESVLYDSSASYKRRFKTRKAFQKWADKTLSFPDRTAIRMIYIAHSHDEMLKGNLGSTAEDLKNQSPEFWERVAERVNDTIGRTQPSGLAEHTSVNKGLSKHSLTMKIFTLYNSQIQRNFNNMDSSVFKYAMNPNTNNRGDMVESVGTFALYTVLVNASVNFARRESWAVFKYLAALARGDDEDEAIKQLQEDTKKGLKKMPKDAILGIFSLHEYADDIVRIIEKAFGGYAEKDVPFEAVAEREMRQVIDMINGVMKIHKLNNDIERGYKETEGKDGRISRKRVNPIKAKEQLERETAEVYNNAIQTVGIVTALAGKPIPTKAVDFMQIGDIVAAKQYKD